MQVDTRPISALAPYARNARTHSPAQIDKLCKSIKEFGWTVPILVDGKNGIIAGHGRLLAAKQLGMTEVPVIEIATLSEAQKRAYVLADNKLAEDAGWDDQLLALELGDLRGLDFDLSLTGFDLGEVDQLFAAVNAKTEPVEPPVPALRSQAVSARGDVWICGPHRVICGDCKDAADVARLFDGQRINLALTSPPYAEQREYDISSGFKPVPPAEYVEWFRPVSALVAEHLVADGSWFINIKPHAMGLDTSLYVFDLVLAHVRDWGWHFATEFCWERGGVPKSVRRRFKNQFEPVYQFTRGDWKIRPEAVKHMSDNVPKPRGKGAGQTSWAKHQGGGLQNINPVSHQGEPGFEWFGDDIERGMAYPGNRLPTFNGTHTALGHQAAFPVGLPAWFMRAFSDIGDRCYDSFLGSGSSLIAAEQEQRIGYGCEISPLYCDVSVRRWQEFTKRHAVRERDGRAFDEIAAQRTDAQ